MIQNKVPEVCTWEAGGWRLEEFSTVMKLLDVRCVVLGAEVQPLHHHDGKACSDHAHARYI